MRRFTVLILLSAVAFASAQVGTTGYRQTIAHSDGTDNYTLARAYEATGDSEAAYSMLGRLVGGDSTLVYDLARMSLQMGRFEDAAVWYAAIVASDSTDIASQINLAEATLRCEDTARAIEICRNILDNHDSAAAWYVLGQCYQAAGDRTAAAGAYHAASLINPANVTYAYRYLTMQNTLDFDEQLLPYIISRCDSALQYNPDNKRIQRLKAQYLYHNKQYYDAWDVLNGALLARGDSSFVTLKYAALTSEGLRFDTKQRLNLLHKALAKDSTDTQVLITLVTLYSSLGRLEAADSCLTRIEELNSPNAAIYEITEANRGDLAIKQRKPYDEIAAHYYNAFLVTETKPAYLVKIANITPDSDRARKLFLLYTTLNIYLATTLEARREEFYIDYLDWLLGELFMEGAAAATMTAPDGQSTTITVEKLEALRSTLSSEK